MFDDEWDEEDWPEDEFDEADVITCPECGADVYEDAPACPVCGHFIIHQNRTWEGKPLWWILLGLAGMIAVILLFSGVLSFLG